MKQLYTEWGSVLALVTASWVLLALADLIFSLLMAEFTAFTFKKTFLRGLLVLALPVVLVGYGVFIERNLFHVEEEELGYADLPEAFDGYRIVHISDIHARSFRKRPDALRRAVRKINDLHPDLIAFTGDLITVRPDETDAVTGILRALQAPDGIVSVMGNHDYSTYAHWNRGRGLDHGMRYDVAERERQMGWHILLNEHLLLTRQEDTLALVGVENSSISDRFPSRGRLQEASEGTDGLFRILLSHDPQHWDTEVLKAGFALTLSGHTHAGQCKILGWSPVRFSCQRYEGLYESDGQRLYINRGLGETIFPARIGVPPEITLITLRRAAE